VAVIRSGIGRLGAIAAPRYIFADPCYFQRASAQPGDYLGSWLLRAAAVPGEPTFVDAAALLAPPHDYKALALPSAYHKWSVTQDGYVKAADGRIYGPTDGADSSKVGRVVFDPKAHAAWWPAVNFTDYKASLYGRRGRAAHVGAWHSGAGRGFSLSCTAAGAGLGSIDPAVAAGESATEWLLLRLGEAGAGGGGANANNATAYRYFRAGAGGGAANLTDGAAFYAALLASETGGGGGAAEDGDDAMGVELHYGAEGRRLVDMAHAAVEDVLGLYVGDFPNYGDGGAYWSVNRNDNGSLPLTTFALDFALLEWGLVGAAVRKLAFYMETWVTAKGFIDQGPGGENPGWMYHCPLGFPDGLSDFGQLLDLWTATARAADGAAGAAAGASNWTAAQLPRAIALANYTLSMRRNATAHALPADRRGLIWGPGEHDTCHYPDYYFSTSMWAWRGMLAFGGWLRGAAAGGTAHAAFAAELLGACAAFRADIRAALDAAIVRGDGRNGTFNGTFVPPVAGAGQTPFGSMTQGRRASYSNFRYFAEMLSAGFLADGEARALAAFREEHGGTLSGMTRYEDHLDDMPAIGYAQSDAALDRLGRFNLLLFGHMANYQSRGTFHSTEQLSLYGAAPANFRAYYTTRAEYDISFCVPSALLVAHMLKLALLWEPRDAVVPTVWLLRMAPRRWYRSGGGGGGGGDRAGGGAVAVAVTNAPTAVGRLSYTVFDAVEQPGSKGAGVRVELSLSRRSSGGLLKVRVRDAAAPGLVLRRLASAAADGPSCPNATIAVDVEGEAVEVAWAGAPPQAGAVWACALVATLV
jgi:hypothetical protein